VRSIIIGLGARLARVHILRVEDRTYFAELQLQRAEGVVSIDARPSDSIAIALRLAAPIFAQESLLTAIAVEGGDTLQSEEPDLTPATDEMSAEQLKEYLERMKPEDFGKFNL
jgi:bifunctional DNase/RNase